MVTVGQRRGSTAQALHGLGDRKSTTAAFKRSGSRSPKMSGFGPEDLDFLAKLEARSSPMNRQLHAHGDPSSPCAGHRIQGHRPRLLEFELGEGSGGRSSGNLEDVPPSPASSPGRYHGHLPWLRAREPRLNMIDQPDPAKVLRHSSSMPSHLPSTPPRAEVERWFRAPPPPGMMSTEGKGMVCWRADFVKEAQRTAESLGSEHPAVDVPMVGEATLDGGETAKWFRDRVVAVCTDGRRQFWSKVFLQSLYVLRSQWQLNEVVCMPESELLLKKPELFFQRPKSRSSNNSKSSRNEEPRPLRVPVPPALRMQRQEPSPPLLPQRLPCPKADRQDTLWARLFKPPATPPDSRIQAKAAGSPRSRPPPLEPEEEEYGMSLDDVDEDFDGDESPKSLEGSSASGGRRRRLPPPEEERNKKKWAWGWHMQRSPAKEAEVKSPKSPAFPRLARGVRGSA